MKEQQIRTVAQAIIRRVRMEVSGADDELNQALEAAYPFGVRTGRVYQIWCEEARRMRDGHDRAA